MHNIINDKSLVIGVMSGTSMDGIDITCAQYCVHKKKWKFNLVASETFAYTKQIKSDLLRAFTGEYKLSKIDIDFGCTIASYIDLFIKKYKLNVDLISSHGHTIFHDPVNGYTKQIGNGRVIAKKLNIPVVSNFRQQDIDYGGQGAPLVPIGDNLLFSEYSSCLNLGGIANISFEVDNKLYGYDICPCNMVLNYLSNKLNKDYDEFGEIASNGKIDNDLFNILNNIDYYKLDIPKSIGKELVEQYFISLIDLYKIDTRDLLSTFVEHIAFQISLNFLKMDISNSLLSGGGAFNKYLIKRLDALTSTNLIIPDVDIVNYKEAIVFGFLGVLRMLNENNCIASVTGAHKDHSSGDVYLV
ncbi:MAG: anhydro-N-acetylmuramic acid kinase [Flavobacteriales bacterium]|nr:anhydro-N-acetylmuramic acid kinase [Flavobacteriales bacterium]|tara:strand:- start:654 stop:1724 length:1071 start_codon:yes stop_codon:yes gene_type:complete